MKIRGLRMSPCEEDYSQDQKVQSVLRRRVLNRECARGSVVSGKVMCKAANVVHAPDVSRCRRWMTIGETREKPLAARMPVQAIRRTRA